MLLTKAVLFVCVTLRLQPNLPQSLQQEKLIVANISHLSLTIHGELIINDFRSIGISLEEYFLKLIKKIEDNISVVDGKWIWTGFTYYNKSSLYPSLHTFIKNFPVHQLIYILFHSERFELNDYKIIHFDKNQLSVHPTNLSLKIKKRAKKSALMKSNYKNP
jgi:hypothetical protein